MFPSLWKFFIILFSHKSNNNNSETTSTTNMSLRKSLLSNFNAKSYGPFLLSTSPNIAEILTGIGYDHIVVDMEHSPLDVSSTISMLRAIDAGNSYSYNSQTNNNNSNSHIARTTPIVRVPSHQDVANTKRVLDILKPPAGIMFPMIETAHQAQEAISSIRYPPTGIRGCAHPFVRASAYGRDTNYYHQTCVDDILTIVQVESEKGIENIQDIGMVDGVDCIFLGPFDISCSIGQMGQFEPGGDVMKLIQRAELLVRETSERKKEKQMQEQQQLQQESSYTPHGLILGGFRSPGRSLQEMFSPDVGYQFVAGSVDIGLIQNAAKVDWMDAKRAIKKATDTKK